MISTENLYDNNNNDADVEFDSKIQRKINYKDYDYVNSEILEIHRRIGILKKMKDENLKVKYWNKLMESKKDSIGTFIEMLKNYRNYKFQFHDLNDNHNNHNNNNDDLNNNNENHRLQTSKDDWNWVFRKLCVNERHRVEMLPSNIELHDLVQDLNELINGMKIEIVFNIGGNNSLLSNSLYQMNSLTWLNISSSQINNSKMQCLIQVINRGLLNNLKAIVITDNDIEKKKLEQDLKKLTRGNLQYIEANFEEFLNDCNHNDIKSLKENEILQEIEVNFEFKLMNDSRKLQYLINRGIIKNEEIKPKDNDEDDYDNNIIQENDRILIDFGVCEKFEWNERVKLGLLNSYKSKSYKVKIDMERAKFDERVLSEKIGGIVRMNYGKPLVKSLIKKKSNKKKRIIIVK